MKQFILLLLCAALLMSLAACGEEPVAKDTTPPDNTTTAAQDTTLPEVTVPTTEKLFAFRFGNAVLTPGTPFDPSVLPEPQSTYSIPSCAFEGTDNVYNYGTFEVTAYNEGKGEIVYSVYFLDPNLETPEGLFLGDDAARVTQLYGEGTVNGTEITYRQGNTLLIIIVENGFVASIEYREAT